MFDNTSKVSWLINISYLVGNSYRSYTERLENKTKQACYQRFRELLVEYQVGGSSYYLCSWKEVPPTYKLTPAQKKLLHRLKISPQGGRSPFVHDATAGALSHMGLMTYRDGYFYITKEGKRHV